MQYDETPDVAALGETDDGLPEIVQFTYDSGRTVTATYRDVLFGINGAEVHYDVAGHDEPVVMSRAAVDDAYDVIKRIGEREGYQDAPDWGDDNLDPLPTDDEESGDSRTVDEILDDDSLDPLF
jgi:hypothetical protein